MQFCQVFFFLFKVCSITIIREIEYHSNSAGINSNIEIFSDFSTRLSSYSRIATWMMLFFRSLTVCGLLLYTPLFKKTHKKKSTGQVLDHMTLEDIWNLHSVKLRVTRWGNFDRFLGLCDMWHCLAGIETWHISMTQ